MRIFESSLELPKGCDVFESSLESTRKCEGREADDKNHRIVSTRQLKSEDVYSSL